MGYIYLPPVTFWILSPLLFFYIIPLSTETTSGLGSKSCDFCESFDPVLHINLVNPNVISILLLLIFILCSSLTFYCILHKQLYRSSGFVLQVQIKCYSQPLQKIDRPLVLKVFSCCLWFPSIADGTFISWSKGPYWFLCVTWDGESALCYLRAKKQTQQTQGSKLAQKKLNKLDSSGELLLLQRIYGFAYRSQKYIMHQEDKHNYKDSKAVLLNPVPKCPTYKTSHCNPYKKYSVVL